MHYFAKIDENNTVTEVIIAEFNFIASGALTTSVDIQSGDTVQFNGNALGIKVV